MFAEFSNRPGGGGAPLPRVVLLRVEPAPGQPGQVAPAGPTSRSAPRPRGPAAPAPAGRMVVSMREEGSPLAWQREVTLPTGAQQRILSLTEYLQTWAATGSGRPATAAKVAQRLGRDLLRSFLGTPGARLLDELSPTALLVQVDQSLVNLPWELLWRSSGPLALQVPVGRVVTTGLQPAPRRNPVAEDPTLRILAIANPTEDLAASEAEIEVVRGLEGQRDGVTVEVTVLERDQATLEALRRTVSGQDFDLLHFAGHASFDSGEARASALQLADGRLRADEVPRLGWAAPPYVVFNSACESARAGADALLFTRRGRVNGLAAAFLSAGVYAYLGHYWPVGDGAARRFAQTFYETLFAQRSIGSAVYAARLQAAPDFFSDADLTGLGAVYFGDPGSAHVDVAAMAS